ncbi:ATP-grasp peptide maturase system methyltransferase [Nonomuraea sp. NPDC023979]|uniref:ATP-grasp peptide maturase system methyltransferase n=1 Tax=Nonomuraea sp. NPDC023979 TaxID=3154796 RepID=UPI0033FDCDC1
MTDPALMARSELADAIGSPAWRTAVEAVPRELFVGGAFYQHDPVAGWTPVRACEFSREEWLAKVYRDVTLVTQVSGVLAEHATHGLEGVVRPTSLSTLPSLVVRMLDAAEIAEGDTVLEIGTGTGYSTALLCHRLGASAVTSVEYDPDVADRAAAALALAGYRPTLVQGDGLHGYAPNAPYRRLIATCAVRVIPAEWVLQVSPGGTITTPMLGWTEGAAFAHLYVADDGTASGRFLDTVWFMPARTHAAPPLESIELGVGTKSYTRTDPSLLKDDTARFVAQLAVPQAQHAWAGDILTLDDPGSGSHADVRPDQAGRWLVHQQGPASLWDDAERALSVWLEAGKPGQSAFTITVTPDRQWVSLEMQGRDDLRWDLPA